MNIKPHGQMTAEIALHLSQDLVKRGYDVLFDHGDSSNENVGRIVSWFGDDLNREAQLSFLDIAIVEHSSQKVFVLVEIEETNDKPKTLLGDIFGVLFGKYIYFKRKKLLVGDFTTLILVVVNNTNHKDRNEYILDQVNRVKTSLGTKNAKIGKVVIKTYTGERELIAQLPSVLDRVIKGEL